MKTPESTRVSLVKQLGIGITAVIVVAGLALLLKDLMSKNPSPPKFVTKISIIPDIPPPPPKEVKPPDPPKEQQKEIKTEQPKQPETPLPPTEALKMEGPAGNGPSPFTAGHVENEYKIGGNSDNAHYSWYAAKLKSEIENALARNKALSTSDFKVVVKLWVSPHGMIEKFELGETTGEPEIDKNLRHVIHNLPALSDVPPEDMPQPITMRITVRSNNTSG